jgi:hypothetical protein
VVRRRQATTSIGTNTETITMALLDARGGCDWRCVSSSARVRERRRRRISEAIAGVNVIIGDLVDAALAAM